MVCGGGLSARLTLRVEWNVKRLLADIMGNFINVYCLIL